VRILPAVTLFLAALWCGALGFFAATAGLVLTTSTTRHAGGTVNRALLDALDVGSYAVIAILFVLLLLGDRAETFTRGTRGALLRLLAVALAATVASHEIVTPQMMELRDRMGTIIDLVPKSDPLRREWGRLHAFSAIALLVRIVSAAVFFGILFRALVPRRQGLGASLSQP
jgi:hypothetical protein